MKIKMRKIDLYITHKQYEILKKESEERGITFSEALRRLIEFYEENKKR